MRFSVLAEFFGGFAVSNIVPLLVELLSTENAFNVNFSLIGDSEIT